MITFILFQNIAMGWGTGIGISLIVVSLEFKNYGGRPGQEGISLQIILNTEP